MFGTNQATPQEQHQHQVLRDFQRTIAEHERAQDVLANAARICKVAKDRADEARKRLRRVAEGGI